MLWAIFFFQMCAFILNANEKKKIYGTGPQQISFSQFHTTVPSSAVNSGIILFSVPISSAIHSEVSIHGKFNFGSLSCLYRYFSKEKNTIFLGQKKPQAPLCLPNPVLEHGSSSQWIFFPTFFSIRLQSCVIPAEGNVIKAFIKGLSRQLLYKLL